MVGWCEKWGHLMTHVIQFQSISGGLKPSTIRQKRNGEAFLFLSLLWNWSPWPQTVESDWCKPFCIELNNMEIPDMYRYIMICIYVTYVYLILWIWSSWLDEWPWLVIHWLRNRWIYRKKNFHRLTAPISFPPWTNPGGIALKPLSSIHSAALVGVACNRVLSSLALVGLGI